MLLLICKIANNESIWIWFHSQGIQSSLTLSTTGDILWEIPLQSDDLYQRSQDKM